MADPATQFQAAGINTNTYTPVKGGDLGGSHLFGGSGQIWAGIGKTALDAAAQLNDTSKMIQASPLNPNVRAQQEYQGEQADAAADHIEWLQAQGRAGQMVMGSDPSGLTTSPAGKLDVDPMIRMALRSAPAKPSTTKTTTSNNGSDNTAAAPKPKTVTEQPYEGYSASSATIGAAPPAPSDSTTTQPSKPKTHTTGDELTDDRGTSTDNDFLLRRMIQERGGSGAAQQGTPASMTFLNPATGNVEPLQTGPPSVFAAKPAAPAPAAPDQTQPAQGGSPAAATQADQVAMQQWQNQNAHPVMSSQDALGWMKNQTTLAQDATYLPMGGPGGAPAFAFHMKGGGQNIVPVSQMVQKGAGPLIAAQNTSQILSATDQQQAGPGAQGQPPAPQDQTQVPTPPNSPPPPANLPPPAPTGPPQAQAQQQYPNISPPAPPSAPGGYNAASYRMPQGPTITATGDVNPSLMAGDTSGQPAAAAPIPQIDPTDFNQNVKGYSKADLAKMKSDPVVSDDYGGYQWRQDRQDGVKYAWLTDPDSPFRELRWKAGLDTWKSTLKENGGLMQQVQAARDKVPLLHGMLSDTQIANMSEEDLKDTLAAAVRLSTTGGDASDQNSLHIRGTINQSQSLARTISMLEAAKKEGIDPRLFSGGAQRSSEEAAKRGETLPAQGEEYPLADMENQSAFNLANAGAVPGIYWDLGWAATHGSQANLTRGQVSPLADKLKSELKYFGEQMQQTPLINITTEPKGAPGEVKLGGGYQGFGGSASVKLPTDESTLKDINRISQGTNIDDMIAGAKALKLKVDNDIVDSTDRATRMNYRTPPQFKSAAQAIKDGKNIEDNENQFVDKNGNPVMPDHYKYPPGRASKIPIGTGTEPNTQVEDEMKRFYGDRPRPATAATASTSTAGPSPTPSPTPGPTPTPGPGEGVVRSEDEAAAYARSHDSGSYVWLNGHRYRVNK